MSDEKEEEQEDIRSLKEALTTWAPILISVGALLLSYASYDATQEFRTEAQQPYFENKETLGKLQRLDTRIQRATNQVQAYENKANSTWEQGRENLSSAREHQRAAEVHWIQENYTDADTHILFGLSDTQNISEASERYQPPSAPEGNALVWIIIALIALAILGVGAYFYTNQEGRRR